jgi:hypothetical protein
MSFPLVTRAYNSWDFDDLRGTITKKSTNDKLLDEIRYYLDLPDEMKIFFPRIVDSRKTGDQFDKWIVMERYDYPNLADYYLGKSGRYMDAVGWDAVLTHLKEIINLWKEFEKSSDGFDDDVIVSMYLEKTYREHEKFKLQFPDDNIFRRDILNFNGIDIYSFHIIYPDIVKYVRNVLMPTYTSSFIHGDFCFGNILIGNQGALRFIDPRGSFGKPGHTGDIRYDVAKLYHSIDGMYDYLNNDEFTLITDKGKTTLEYEDNTRNMRGHVKDKFKKLFFTDFSEKEITMIEGLIFVGACARHYENPARQKAMYFTGLERLNWALML